MSAAAKSESNRIRGLDGLEQFVDACTLHRNLNIGLSVCISTTKTFNFSDIENALKQIQDEHLQLQACIRRDEEIPEKGWSINPLKWFRSPPPTIKPEFWSMPKDKIKVPLQWIKVKDLHWLKDVLENTLQATFEEGCLLWRAFWVEDISNESASGDGAKGTLILTFHPAVSDLKGTFIYLNEFINHFDLILRGKTLPKRKEPEFHPSVESVVSNVENFNWLEKLGVMKTMVSCMLGTKSPYLKAPSIPDYTTRHINFNITAEESMKILKWVESSNTSLHALITSAAAIATYRILKLDKPATFKSTHEANLRLCASDYEATKGHIHGGLCNYIEEAIKITSIQNKDQFLNFVSEIHSSVVRKLRSDHPMKFVKFCFSMGSPYSYFANYGTTTLIRNEFSVAVNEDLDDLLTVKETIKLEKMHVTVAAQNMGSPYHLMANVFDKQIHYGIAYYGNTSRKEDAVELGQKTLEVIKTFLQ